MGYTHYFTVHGWHTPEWQAVWPKLVEDAHLIVEAADVLIAAPTRNADEILPPILNVEEGIIFNGVADDGHEAFVFTERYHDQFVKTLQKPYDAAVACILLRAYILAPDNMKVYSDGFWNQTEWKKARQLYRQIWPQEPISCPWSEDDQNDEEDSNANAEGKLEMSKTRSSIKIREDTTRLMMSRLRLHQNQVPLQPTREVRLVEMDFDELHQWLSRCDEDPTHNNCKPSQIQWQDLPGVRFKVVDMKKCCVINAPKSLSFVALSYVWGEVDQSKLTTDTAPFLMEDGGLKLFWDLIPATVRDAIAVCEKLGERYLWIDALCIMQDSQRDTKIQILRMRQIYSAAKLTIVAASTKTASAGLVENRGSLASLCDDSLNSFHRLIEESPWSTRAWCYQEKVLSHRAIFFTTQGTYVQCQNGTFATGGRLLPETQGETSLPKFNTLGGMLSIPPGADLESYISAVEYFSQRQLTDEADKLNAFQGILRLYAGKLDNDPSSFCFGLPISSFDQTICWRSLQHNPRLRNMKFPSWSWLGWNDTVRFDRELIQRGRTNHMIYGFDRFDGSGRLDAITQLRKPILTPLESRIEFGFPTSSGGQFYNSPTRYIVASTADLIIDALASRTEGSNGLYAVYPAKCGGRPPPPPPKPRTILDVLTAPLPEIKWMDAESEAAPSVPAKKQSEDYATDEHETHDNCAAKSCIGHIWLDKVWRENQGARCIRQFMPVAGRKDDTREGQWLITMLMCMQRMEKNGHFWAHERVQIMDCEIEESRWLDAWAETTHLVLT